MKYLLVIKAEAHNDVVEAYEYYENIQTGLGERFLNALIERYNDIAEHPDHYCLSKKMTNKFYVMCGLRRFPF